MGGFGIDWYITPKHSYGCLTRVLNMLKFRFNWRIISFQMTVLNTASMGKRRLQRQQKSSLKIDP